MGEFTSPYRVLIIHQRRGEDGGRVRRLINDRLAGHHLATIKLPPKKQINCYLTTAAADQHKYRYRSASLENHGHQIMPATELF